jgi:hypothetical protein
VEVAAVMRMRVETTLLRAWGRQKEAAFCGTAKNTVRVRLALNYWCNCHLRDFKKSVEIAKK